MPRFTTRPDTIFIANEVNSDWNSFVFNTGSYTVPSRGSIFEIDPHPTVASEYVRQEDSLVYSLPYNSSIDGIVQVFRASFDNIHNISLPIRIESGGQETIDYFETYASTTELRNTWTGTNVDTVVFRATDRVYQGTYSMRIEQSSTSVNDRITRTYSTPLNLLDNGYFEFALQSDKDNRLLRMFISDGTNEAYTDFTVSTNNTWFVKQLNISSFTNISTVDRSSITSIGFEVITSENIKWWFDSMILSGQPDLSADIEMEVIDFGTTSAPSTMGTTIPNDDGHGLIGVAEQYKKRVNFHAHINSHEDSNPLTIGNYYGLYIKRPQVGTLHFYGPSTKVYNSGDLYTNDGGTLSSQNASIGFNVGCSPPSLLKYFEAQAIGGDPANTIAHIFFENGTSSRKIGEIMFDPTTKKAIANLESNLQEEIIVDKGNLHIEFDDDLNATYTSINVLIKYYYNGFQRYL